MKIKTITVDGFNSEYFDKKVNNFLNIKNIKIIDVVLNTAIAGQNVGYKMTYTAFIKYEEV